MKDSVFARVSRAARRKPVLVASCLVAALVVSGGGIAMAAGGLAPPAVAPATIYKPSVVPDRIVLTPTATPAKSQNVTWRTSTAVTAPKAQFAPMTTGPVSAAGTVTATTISFATDLGYSISEHTATLTDLTPNTDYLYRVGDGDTWSEWIEFTTAAEGMVPFSFIMQGDGQNDNKAYTSRAMRAATEARPYAKTIIHAGDLIDTDVSDAEWGEWFFAAGFMNGSMNILAAAGNHEYYPGPNLSQYWPAQFEYPLNGPDSSTRVKDMFAENVYSVDYQGVRFISLNSNFPGDTELMTAQTAWLEDQLKNNPSRWTVVSFHHPVFSVSSGRNNVQIREAWLPLFEKYNVDIVMQGHDHAYGRGNLKTNDIDTKTSKGPVYMVSVAGPKYYIPDPLDNNNWVNNGANLRKVDRDTQLYQIVDVTNDELHMESWSVDGSLVDSFTIDKAANGSKIVKDESEARASGPGSTRGTGTNSPEIPDATVPGATTPPTTPPTTEPPTTTPPTTEPPVVTKTKVKPTVVVNRSGKQTYGSSTRVTATITVPKVAGKVPAGAVTVYDGSTPIAKNVKLSSSGKATVKISATLKAGKHSINAVYVPSSSAAKLYTGVRSAGKTVTVAKATSKVSVKLSKKSISAKSKGKLTVTVKVSGVSTPGAKLTVLDGKKKIKTVTLKSSAKGKVSISLPKLKKGTHKITVTYAGTANVKADSSSRVSLKVK